MARVVGLREAGFGRLAWEGVPEKEDAPNGYQRSWCLSRILWVPIGILRGLSETLQKSALAAALRADTIRPNALRQGMSATPTSTASQASESSLSLRLSAQLESLSQVGEVLTFRLLELEERLSRLELQLSELDQSSSGDAHSSDTAEMLAVTEERISRLEELLSEPQQGQRLNLVRPLSPIDRHDNGSFVGSEPEEEPEMELDPFPEEEEQPFMDELIA